MFSQRTTRSTFSAEDSRSFKSIFHHQKRIYMNAAERNGRQIGSEKPQSERAVHLPLLMGAEQSTGVAPESLVSSPTDQPAAALKAPSPPRVPAPVVDPAPSPAAPKTPAMGAISEDEPVAEEQSQSAAEPDGPSEPLILSSIETMTPAAVLSSLGVVTEEGNVELAAACCRRVRVLCREYELRKACDQLGAARILIAAHDAMPTDQQLVLQALAALVNLCSGESNTTRTTAVEAGAIRAAASAITSLGSVIEIGEMACLVVQNLCYGDDPEALNRRRHAADDGAIEAVVSVLNQHPEINDTCCSSLRLCVDRMPDLRQRAVNLGAPEEAVKPITKESGGLLSFRTGWGTSRSRKREH